jgi:hypothetical protein
VSEKYFFLSRRKFGLIFKIFGKLFSEDQKLSLIYSNYDWYKERKMKKPKKKNKKKNIEERMSRWAKIYKQEIVLVSSHHKNK